LLLQHGENAAIRALIEDGSGSLWVRLDGEATTSWMRLSSESTNLVPLAQIVGETLTNLDGVCPDGDLVWMAAPGKLLAFQNGAIRTVSTNVPWGRFKVRAACKDAVGDLWILTYGESQLHRFRRGEFGSIRKEEIHGAEDLRCLRADREGNVWVGSGSGGLIRVQPRELLSILVGSDSTRDEVFSVAPGREGRVWMATSSGIVSYQGGQFQVYSNVVSCLID
jgi:ligand-binding sensor domain-containing protein